ncbi:MAG: hypothetical protein WD512_04755, partial [Candidatus Paceibacterota bacterium]
MSLEKNVGEKKRGKKKDILVEKTLIIPEEEVVLHDAETILAPKIPKKRGRKPKGGKIIKPPIKDDDNEPDKQNIILHLKCSIDDIEENIFSSSATLVDKSLNENVDGFSFSNNKDLPYEFIKPAENHDDQDQIKDSNAEKYVNRKNDTCHDDSDNVKDIWKKLTDLENCLHNNDVSDKKSACFWCTCDFDNPPIFIPRYQLNNAYHVYGCFCSPECATAFLMKESIDTASKFERYHLLNHIYCKIYNYEKNIKPAPNPFYTLNKYYGNLTIQEYRKLLKNERLLLVVDKPLTRQLPEL